MGRSLQLKTVAEGVETPAQRDLLHHLGCDMIQGYVVSPALDAAAAHTWLQQNNHAVQGQ